MLKKEDITEEMLKEFNIIIIEKEIIELNKVLEETDKDKIEKIKTRLFNDYKKGIREDIKKKKSEKSQMKK